MASRLLRREPRTWTSRTRPARPQACRPAMACHLTRVRLRQKHHRRRASRPTRRAYNQPTARGVQATRHPHPVRWPVEPGAMASRPRGLMTLTIPPRLPSLSSTQRPKSGVRRWLGAPTRAALWTPRSNSHELHPRSLPRRVCPSQASLSPKRTRRSYITRMLRPGLRRHPTARTRRLRPTTRAILASGWDDTGHRPANGSLPNSSLRIRTRPRRTCREPVSTPCSPAPFHPRSSRQQPTIRTTASCSTFP